MSYGDNRGELANSKQAQTKPSPPVSARLEGAVSQAGHEAEASRILQGSAAALAGQTAYLAGLPAEKLYDSRPATPTADKPIEVCVVGRRCVYVNDRRIAGGKPYVSEGLPSHTLKTTLGDVLEAFPEAEIMLALAERRARGEYFAAYHAAKAAATGEAGDAQ